MILTHMAAFFLGYVLDLILGDPHGLPHPVCLIGKVISQGEKKFYQAKNKRKAGQGLVVLVLALTGIASASILIGAYMIHPVCGMVVETLMTYQILAVKSLKTESMKVYHKLVNQDLQGARQAVSMIVGRDTQNLDEAGVTKAAVETVAENTSDGVIGPMIYLFMGGPVLGFLYKAVNTMDSMIGYQNERYQDFGRCAAKLDDVVNFVPARISAMLMLLSCAFLGRDYNMRNGWRIFLRDRYHHKSPNSAQTEAVCAGALGLQLAGDGVYFGKVVHKEYIGDPDRKIQTQDIKRANRLLYMTAFLGEIISLLILWGIYLLEF